MTEGPHSPGSASVARARAFEATHVLRYGGKSIAVRRCIVGGGASLWTEEEWTGTGRHASWGQNVATGALHRNGERVDGASIEPIGGVR